uniref:Uncharacterized protein n=1 Tax=Pavo cristatus TaxID=9049 RepID=A0A8C9FP73_PAVCR
MPSYQLRTPTTNLPQGVVMAASPGALHSPQQLAEEATRKRELRLMKNRNYLSVIPYTYSTDEHWPYPHGFLNVLKFYGISKISIDVVH